MKCWLSALLLCIGFACQAQSGCAEKMQAYGLNPDSASTPYLFYKSCEWLGVRYRYAGHTKKGIDCSGFSKMLYSDVYCIPLSGGSRDLWLHVKPIHRDSLQEGDLLFFKIRKGRISHVGVYLGHNKMVHASVRWGVIVSDLNEPYYKKYYFSGGRINP